MPTAANPGFSPWVLAALLAVAAAAWFTFWQLVRQWTAARRWTAWSYWAREHGWQLEKEFPADMAALVHELAERRPRALACLAGRGVALIRMRTADNPASRNPDKPANWNLLVRRIAVPWPPTGLRPSAHAASMLDLVAMSSFPSLIPPERFVLFAVDADDARVLAASPVRALLPADVGLLLFGEVLVLDFSTRPFDEIEFDRQLALAEQITANLPAPKSGSGRRT